MQVFQTSNTLQVCRVLKPKNLAIPFLLPSLHPELLIDETLDYPLPLLGQCAFLIDRQSLLQPDTNMPNPFLVPIRPIIP